MHENYLQNFFNKSEKEANASLIIVLTDFGLMDSAVGQVKAALNSITPKTTIVGLLHDAPEFHLNFSSYLLAAYSQFSVLEKIFVAVLDPKVGSDSYPIVVRVDGKCFVRPNNGLLKMVISRAQRIEAWKIKWRPCSLSASFHGGNIFAPVAPKIAMALC